MNPLQPTYITSPASTHSGEFALDAGNAPNSAFKDTFRDELAQNRQIPEKRMPEEKPATAKSENKAELADDKSGPAKAAEEPADKDAEIANEDAATPHADMDADETKNGDIKVGGAVSDDLESSDLESGDVNSDNTIGGNTIDGNVISDKLASDTIKSDTIKNDTIKSDSLNADALKTDNVNTLTEEPSSATLVDSTTDIINVTSPNKTEATIQSALVKAVDADTGVNNSGVVDKSVANGLTSGSLTNAATQTTTAISTEIPAEQQKAALASRTSYINLQHGSANSQPVSTSGLSEHVKILADGKAEVLSSESEKTTQLQTPVTKEMSNLLKTGSGLASEEFSLLERGKLFRLANTLEGSFGSLASAEKAASEQQQQATTASNFVNASPLHKTEGARMQMPVNISFGQPQWAGQIAERAAMMSYQKIQSAELQLDPPELGSLQVKVSVNNEHQASVTFSSPHANVREALDQTLVRLRELLEQQGLDLVDVNVSDQQQQEGSGEEYEEHPSDVPDAQLADEESRHTIDTVVSQGIDFYA